MKAKPNPHKEQSVALNKLNHSHNRPMLVVACASLLLTILLAGSWAWAQSAPYLTVAPTGTNQLLISITNGVSTTSYELWTTPVLGDATSPWTVAAVGSVGQTNFTVNAGPYQTGFFRVVVDTNGVPLWQAADPNNPGAGILAVFIDSPVNGALLQ